MIAIADPARYANLARLVAANSCKRIVEIGVFNGVHGLQMIDAAKGLHEPSEIFYYGFDLFEDLTRETYDKEFSKVPFPLARLELIMSMSEVNIKLFKGNTRDTLSIHLDAIRGADIIFVDGGHSVETIASDWDNIKQVMGDDTIVVFDDYYIDSSAMYEADIGCNRLIDNLDREQYLVKFLQPVDSFEKPWGVLRIQMVKVMLNV